MKRLSSQKLWANLDLGLKAQGLLHLGPRFGCYWSICTRTFLHLPHLSSRHLPSRSGLSPLISLSNPLNPKTPKSISKPQPFPIMVQPKFVKPKKESNTEPSPNLYVANCGPSVGLSLDQIASVFSAFGELVGVHEADESGSRVIVSYSKSNSAQAALKMFDGIPCPLLGGRTLHIRYSVLQPSSQVNDSVSVSLEASDLQIPGLYLLHDFITTTEEEELLVAVDSRPWKSLAKRRVQHYGYEFLYETRNVNTKHHIGELPSFVSSILKKMSSFPNHDEGLDQLTVNEYPPGVGLSPHIDTHSAFEGSIFSLSLAGSCIMEFRRYSQGSWRPPVPPTDKEAENSDHRSKFVKRALFLPPRSILLLSGEARYAWHHYIPHHKVDMVGGDIIRRSLRRVSFTFRKVRNGPCCCEFPQYCDSQRPEGPI